MTITRGTATGGPTTSSTTSWPRARSRRSSWSCRSATAAPTSTATGLASRREGSGGVRGDPALYERDLLEDIIPLVDGKYRTIPDRKQRAIVGFSMGGGQAGRYGLRHLETFSTVGIMSAGLERRRQRRGAGGRSGGGAGRRSGQGEQADRSAVDRVRQGRRGDEGRHGPARGAREGRHRAHLSRNRGRTPLASLAPLPARPRAAALQ